MSDFRVVTVDLEKRDGDKEVYEVGRGGSKERKQRNTT